MTPLATPITLAIIMSTTRQEPFAGFCGADEPEVWEDVEVVSDECTDRALSVEFTGHGLEKSPCAGMIQIRFDGRSQGSFLSARFTGLPCSDSTLDHP
jgi:hypothetical protein